MNSYYTCISCTCTDVFSILCNGGLNARTTFYESSLPIRLYTFSGVFTKIREIITLVAV